MIDREKIEQLREWVLARRDGMQIRANNLRRYDPDGCGGNQASGYAEACDVIYEKLTEILN